VFHGKYQIDYDRGYSWFGEIHDCTGHITYMQRQGYEHKWWYEEEQGHPVYIYHDYETMQKIVDDLSNGNYRKVIDMALKRWHEFAAAVKHLLILLL
jgi:hypothetical protein